MKLKKIYEPFIERDESPTERWNGKIWETTGRYAVLLAGLYRGIRLPDLLEDIEKLEQILGSTSDEEFVHKVRMVRSIRSLMRLAKPIVKQRLMGTRDWVQFGQRLVAKQKNLSEIVLGYTLIGLGVQRSMVTYVNYRLCGCWFCFRHVRDPVHGRRAYYCGRHAPGISDSGYMWAKRLTTRINKSDQLNSQFAEWIRDARAGVRGELCKGIYKDIGLTPPSILKHWRKTVEKWSEKYPWLPASVKTAHSWTETLQALRYVLDDVYCHSSNTALWNAKLYCFDLERKLPMIYDRRRFSRSTVPSEITRLAKKGLSKSEIAVQIGVGKSAISNCLKRHPKLQQLFTGRGKYSANTAGG